MGPGDLPIYRSGHLVVADASAERGVSVPVLGVTRLRPRVREATLQLAHELYKDEDTVRDAAYGYRQRRRNESQDDSEDDTS